MSLAPWHGLRRFTPARVALGRAGNGLPTAAHLAFLAAHAAARDAVHAALDVDALQAALDVPGLVVHSACPDRRTYLLRPDLGRRLRDEDRDALRRNRHRGLAIVLCDGLSALAVQRHAAALVAALLAPGAAGANAPDVAAPDIAAPDVAAPDIAASDIAAPDIGPVIIARQARVALGDAVGEALGAEAVLVLIGERPGLSAADSLGAYLTWQPRIGRHDAERNCVSNIRPDGLPIPAAAAKLRWLIAEMRRLRLTGVGLKDNQPALAREGSAQDRSISVVNT